MRLKAGAARISVCHVFLFRFMGIALGGARGPPDARKRNAPRRTLKTRAR